MAITGIKSLLPALREKKRYVVCEVLSEKLLSDERSAANAIRASFISLFGEMSLARAGLQAVMARRHAPNSACKNEREKEMKNEGEKEPKSVRAIVRVAHTTVRELKAALLCIRMIEHQPVIVRSVAVSGILKKAKTFL